MLFVVARSRTDAVFDDTARFGDAVHGGDDRAQAALEFFNGLLDLTLLAALEQVEEAVLVGFEDAEAIQTPP